MINSVLRRRLNSPHPRQASEAAYRMAAHGPRTNQAILRKRLADWNAKWSDKTDIPPEAAVSQSELIRAVIHGLNWQLSKEEADVFRSQCLSACAALSWASRSSAANSSERRGRFVDLITQQEVTIAKVYDHGV